jgi:membrane-bound lytic murein transglycosylase D
MDPEASTKAACRYLRELYGYFDDWELALAAYNAGTGKVRSAIRRSGYKKNFWEIYKYLPRETRSYVPQFIAIMYVANFAEEHNFYIEDLKDYMPETDTILVNDFLYFKTFADLTGICAEDLERLNPLVRRVPSRKQQKISSSGSRHYIKPEFEANRVHDPGFRPEDREGGNGISCKEFCRKYLWPGKDLHTVRSGEVLGLIAEKYKVVFPI